MIAERLRHLHTSGYLIAWSPLQKQESPRLCRVAICRSFVTGWFVILLAWVHSRLSGQLKIYVGLEAKKHIVLNICDYLKQMPCRESLPLKNRVFALAGKIEGCRRFEKLQELFSTLLSPYDDETAEDWTRRIIDTFEIKKGIKSASMTMTLVDFPPSKIAFYQNLQREIAKIIPEESQRPTIDLRIRGMRARRVKTVGILGGMGPISDSEIIEMALRRLTGEEREKVSLDLYSSPPPRTLCEKLSRGLRYLGGVRAFASRPDIGKIYLTSNSAHVSFLAWKSRCCGKLLNLVDEVVEKLPKDFHECYLILGTKEAFDHQLYQKKLALKNICFAQVSEEESREVQRIIQQAKECRLRPSDRQSCLEIIRACQSRQESGSPITHLLLGCTELSMVFERFGFLQRECGLKVVDTKNIFAEIIARV